ncbi:MAG TPA: muconolactone Delta-isomerase family protein [Ktedonobacteraceae bacterium]|jgi:muconolactone delta-isomerase
MRFMVNFSTRPGSEEAAVALIPAEQARIRALSEQGIVEALYLATDRARGWLVMKSESLAQAQEYLQTLPLHAYLEMDVIQIR